METPETRDRIVAIIVDCLKTLGRELDQEDLLTANEGTRLFGEKSGIDSIGLVALIADIEDQVSRETGKNVVIADERALSLLHSPFRRVGTLADYIVTLLEKA